MVESQVNNNTGNAIEIPEWNNTDKVPSKKFRPSSAEETEQGQVL